MATSRRRDDRVQIGYLQVAQKTNLKNKWQIDGTTVTTTAAELNLLDGLTATYAELNLLDGATADGTIDPNLAVIAGPLSEVTGFGNMGQAAAGTFSYGILRSGSVNVTSTPAELNISGGMPADVVYTIGSEVNGGTITVGVQVKDAAGANLAIPVSLFQYLSDSNAGLTLSVTEPNPGGGAWNGFNATAGTITIHNPINAGDTSWHAITTAAGTLAIPIPHAGVKTWYMVTAMPTGKLDISGAITFA